MLVSRISAICSYWTADYKGHLRVVKRRSTLTRDLNVWSAVWLPVPGSLPCGGSVTPHSVAGLGRRAAPTFTSRSRSAGEGDPLAEQAGPLAGEGQTWGVGVVHDQFVGASARGFHRPDLVHAHQGASV